MKRMAPLAVFLLLALPILGAEEKAAQKPKPQTPPPTAAQPAAAATQAAPAAAPEPAKLAAEAPAEGDSPLVALAKRSPKTPKKGSIIINNGNLGGKNAKVTTTASQKPLATAAKPEEESDSVNNVVAVVDQMNKSKAKPADKKPLTEAEKAKRMESARAKLENDSLDLDDGDPARVEHQLEQTSKAKTQPTTTTADPKKP